MVTGIGTVERGPEAAHLIVEEHRQRTVTSAHHEVVPAVAAQVCHNDRRRQVARQIHPTKSHAHTKSETVLSLASTLASRGPLSVFGTQTMPRGIFEDAGRGTG